MRRPKGLRPLPAAPINVDAQRRRALALRGRCSRHNIGYPLNILHQGVVIAAGCPMCYPKSRANGLDERGAIAAPPSVTRAAVSKHAEKALRMFLRGFEGRLPTCADDLSALTYRRNDRFRRKLRGAARFVLIA